MGVGGRSLSVLTSLCSACSSFSRAPLYYIIFWPATCNSERRVPVSTLIHLASVELPASSYPNHAKRVSQSEVQSCCGMCGCHGVHLLPLCVYRATTSLRRALFKSANAQIAIWRACTYWACACDVASCACTARRGTSII